MDMKNIPFDTTLWSQIVPTEHKGETGIRLTGAHNNLNYPGSHG